MRLPPPQTPSAGNAPQMRSGQIDGRADRRPISSRAAWLSLSSFFALDWISSGAQMKSNEYMRDRQRQEVERRERWAKFNPHGRAKESK